jgi:hypothetical protein
MPLDIVSLTKIIMDDTPHKISKFRESCEFLFLIRIPLPNLSADPVPALIHTFNPLV